RLSPPRKAELAAALAATHEAAIPVFDRAALLDRVLDDEEIARVVIAGFLGDIPGQIELLKGYAAAGGTQQVEQQAHRIKGAAATVGGEALSALAALEQAGSAGDVALISARAAELDAQFAALKGAMQK
ncbi:MAG: Hpt domain-containing protein, partial [Verrucomicrobiota bacterium]